MAQRFADSMVDPLCNHRGLSDGCGSHWNISWRIPLEIPSFGSLLSLLFLCMETSEAAILGYDLPKVNTIYLYIGNVLISIYIGIVMWPVLPGITGDL